MGRGAVKQQKKNIPPNFLNIISDGFKGNRNYLIPLDSRNIRKVKFIRDRLQTLLLILSEFKQIN